MTIEKASLDNTASRLIEKAEDCFELAKTQHVAADKEHEIAARQLDNAASQRANADKQQEIAAEQHKVADKIDTSAAKLDALGNALTEEALEIKGGIEWSASRNSPPLRLLNKSNQ